MGLELLAKVRIARKDPAALFRAVKGIVAEPAPQSRTADLGDQTPCLRHLRDRERGPGNSAPVRKFARPYFTGTTRLGQKRALGTPRGGTVTSVRANRLRYSRTIALGVSSRGAMTSSMASSGRMWTGSNHHAVAQYFLATAFRLPGRND